MREISFCPYKDCKYHNSDPERPKWYSPFGSYSTLAFGMVERFKCSGCGRTFSLQRFSIDFFAKKTLDYKDFLDLLSSQISLRAIQREMDVSMGTVFNKILRLINNGLIKHDELNGEMVLNEDLVIKVLEGFPMEKECSNTITEVCGEKSQYTYCLNCENEVPVDTEKEEVSKVLTDVARLVDKRTDGQTSLYVYDKHYTGIKENVDIVKVVKEGKLAIKTGSIQDIFLENSILGNILKVRIGHSKETVCYPENVNNSIGRLFLQLIDHNLRNVYGIKGEGKIRIRPTHIPGLPLERVERAFQELITLRGFLSHSSLSGFYLKLYLRKLKIPGKEKAEYYPKYMLM